MSKEMIISVNGREKKIAIVENGLTTEFYIERGEENSGIVGNIYKGRVQRVLPGMQSAFVDIGLDRDAFLYVSDFFDEEEEIERIVLEKKEKEQKTDDEADKAATDEIHKSRLKRDKKIDNVQEKAEITTESDEEDDKSRNRKTGRKPSRKKSPDRKKADDAGGRQKKEPTGGRQKKESTGGRQKKEAAGDRQTRERVDNRKKPEPKRKHENVLDASDIDIEMDSSFERIVDEDSDTGEMLKDAMMQEAISDKVRSIEFDMESVDSAEVGSLIDSVPESGFKRIADEEEEDEPKSRSSKGGRSRKSPSAKAKSSQAKKKSGGQSGKEDKEKDEKPGSDKKDSSARQSRSRREAKANSDDEDSGSNESKTESDGESSKNKRDSGRNPDGGDKGREDADLNDFDGSSAGISNDVFDVSEMAVRRGSRGGKRRTTSPGKKPATTTTHMDKGYKAAEIDAPVIVEDQIANAEFKKPERGRGRKRDRQQPKITDLLREGQEILVQIAKEPIARKGARITSHIALPGRFLVYMPTIEHLGVSRKIESSKERGRLRNMLQKVISKEEIPSGGFIVRTAGVGKSEDEIRDDARYLAKSWIEIKKEADKSKSRALIHQDLDIILRLLRDHLSDDFAAIRVDSEEEFQRIVEFVNKIQPKLVKRVKFHTLDEPILDTFGVSDEIDKALKHRVWLKSGGYLVLNQTEALIAIDVNTGKFVGKGNARLEDTITKTNMEAVKEIARQIRLRDLGGIIVLDLIDMEDRNNRKKVLAALQEQLSKDKSPTKVLSFNDFGLIIMTRKRVKQSLERTLCSPCENCDGAGWIKSAQTICYEILEESRRLSKNLIDVRQTTLRVHPIVAAALQDEEKAVFELIENFLGVVDINGDKGIHQEQFDFAFV